VGGVVCPALNLTRRPAGQLYGLLKGAEKLMLVQFKCLKCFCSPSLHSQYSPYCTTIKYHETDIKSRLAVSILL
jgi:hypothetical protein